MAESGGLLNRCTGLNLYPGFESLPHRQLFSDFLNNFTLRLFLWFALAARCHGRPAIESPHRVRPAKARLAANAKAVTRSCWCCRFALQSMRKVLMRSLLPALASACHMRLPRQPAGGDVSISLPLRSSVFVFEGPGRP